MSSRRGVIGGTLGKAEGRPDPIFFSLGPDFLAFNGYIALWVGWTEEATLEKDLASKWALCPGGLFFLPSSG